MQNKIIAASAGSGKTFQLTNRFLELILQEIPVENILASTFTVKASNEILFKIIKKAAETAIDDVTFCALKDNKNYDKTPFIPSLAKYKTKEQLQPLVARLARELYKMRVGTLDSVFNKIATAFSLELKLPLGWTMVADDDFDRSVLEAVQHVLKNQKGKLGTILADFYKGETKRSIVSDLVSLAKDYLRIVRETKEEHWSHRRLLRNQLSSDDLDDQLTLLMNAEVPRNKPNKDFPEGKEHANSVKAKKKIRDFVLAEQWKEILGHTIVQAVYKGIPYDSKDITGDFHNAIETISDHAFAVEIDKAVGETKAAYKLLKLIAEKYEEVIEKYHSLQFDDITHRLSNAVSDETNLLANTETLNHRLNAEANHLLFDEFQDTSKPQWNVLRPFVQHADHRTNKNGSVFVVGDMKQAIFGWRGGVAEIFDTVKHDLGINKPDEMPESQRSAPAIIEAVNQLFTDICNNKIIQSRDNKNELKHPEYIEAATLWSGRFQPHVSANRNKNLSGYISLVVCPQDVVESEESREEGEEIEGDSESENDGAFDPWHIFVAQQIQTLRTDKPDAEIGVLVGRNKEIGKIVAALKAAKDSNGEPVPIEASQEGGVPLADSIAVQYILSAMKFADHPGDTTAKYHLETSPIELEFSAIDGKLHLKSKEKLKSGYYPLTGIDYRQSMAIRRNIIKNGYGKTIKEFADVLTDFCDSREYELLQKLVELAYQFDKEQIGVRTKRFISRVETARVESPNAAKVRVMNYYASKGLEFDVVVLPDLKEELTKRYPNYVIARKTSPNKITNSAAEPVEWVLRYVEQCMQDRLPKEYQKAFSDRTKNEMIEKLSVLYVAMTRPKRELLLLLQPNKLSKADKSPEPKKEVQKDDAYTATYGGIICAGFNISSLKNVAGQTVTLAGNADWYKYSEFQNKKQIATISESETLNCKFESGRVRLVPTTPSSLEQQVFETDASKDGTKHHITNVALRGTALHKCFESVQWLDEKPSRADLLKLVERELVREKNDLKSQEIIDDFDKFCQNPAVKKLLSKSNYSKEVEVELERRFVVRDIENGILLHGSIDRLVIQKKNGKVTALEIYDYKSGSTDTSVYKPQLDAYKRAMQLLYREVKDIKAYLVYIEKEQDNIITVTE
jgi:ATP-dependent exoDNAse (exonuclease V) beta subunit